MYIKKKTNRENLISVIPLNYPISIDLELTNHCNFSCLFCPIGRKEEYKKEIGFSKLLYEDVVKLVRELKENNVKLKTFRFSMMGESTLHPDFDRITKLVSQSNISEYLELTTNGSTLSKKKIIPIIENKINILRISIYGLNDKEYKKNTKTNKNNFELIKKNLKNLRDAINSYGYGPHIYIKSFENKKERVNEFIKQFSPYADEIGFENGHEWDNNSNIEKPLNSILDEKERKKVCSFPFYKAVIHSNGDFTFCCVDWSRSTSVGNIKNSSIQELFNSKKSNDFRRSLVEGKNLNKVCNGCEFFKSKNYSLDNLDNLTLKEFDNKYV